MGRKKRGTGLSDVTDSKREYQTVKRYYSFIVNGLKELLYALFAKTVTIFKLG